MQRSLPRPPDVNHSILRPNNPNDPPLNDLQKVRVFSAFNVCLFILIMLPTDEINRWMRMLTNI